MHKIACINYFFSSKHGFGTGGHMSSYTRRNCGTNYWSIENGRNHLLIERLVEKLQKLGGTSVKIVRG